MNAKLQTVSATVPPVGKAAVASPQPPEGTHKDAGTASLGSQVFSGQVGGAACTGCHGSDGTGSPLGPDLTSGKYVWGDGSVAAIKKTIAAGVPNPKNYRGPMPPMGGAQLSPEQLDAVAAYVHGLAGKK
jgi:mono/diheme cytochrome c family protein